MEDMSYTHPADLNPVLNASDLEHPHDIFEYYWDHRFPLSLRYVIFVVFAIIIPTGMCINITGLVIVIRNRLWLKHEGYVYLAALFSSGIVILLFDSGQYAFYTLPYTSNPFGKSEFLCKVWHFFTNFFYSSGWLSVALLFDVYLREHIVHRRRCGCPLFASKFCTVFASKIVIGIVFALIFIFGVCSMVTAKVSTNYRYGSKCYSEGGLFFGVMLSVKSILMWVLPFVLFLPVILILTLCVSREGGSSGFSQIEDRSIADDHFRTLAVTLSSMTFFSQFIVFVPSLILTSFPIYLFIQIAYCSSLVLQPVFCLILMKNFRGHFLQMLRGIPCCRRCCGNRLFSDEEERVVRMDSLNNEQQPTTPE